MPIDATLETFDSLIGRGNVLVDFWGPRCAPCIALMPAVEELERRYEGRVQVVKVNATENREICREVAVLGLPTYVTFRQGVEMERLTGNPTIEEIEAAVAKLAGGGD